MNVTNLRKSTSPVIDSGEYMVQRGTNGAAHVVDGSLIPMGYQQLSSLSSATGLTVPTGARVALIVAETQGVRFRDDGTAPTATVGMPLPANTQFQYSGNLSKIKFIEQAASAKLNVLYYA